jgi:DTW domain-containing protein YfiP
MTGRATQQRVNAAINSGAESGLDAFRCDDCGQRNELCDCDAPREYDVAHMIEKVQE